MGLFAPKSKVAPGVTGLHVPSSLVGSAIPVIMGRARANLKLIFAGNFQSRQTNSKKGKSTKKLGKVTAYSFAGDYLLGYSPIVRAHTVWMNKDTLFGVLPTSQVFHYVGTFGNWNNGFGPVDDFVTGSPGIFAGIYAITIQRPFSVTYNDYGGPGPVSYAGTEEKPIYNGQSIPIQGAFGLDGGAGFFGWDVSSYELSTVLLPVGTTEFLVYFDPPIVNPVVTVWYYYASPFTGGQLPLSAIGAQFEDALGDGTEFNYPGGSSFQINYPEFAGIGVPFVDLGASNMAPTISIGVIGYNNLWPTGDTSPVDVILDIITSGNLYANGGVWNHGLNFFGNDANTNQFSQGDMVAEPQILDDPPRVDNLTGSVASLGLKAVRDYCLAYGIKGSHYAETQRAAKDWITDLADIANCYIVWNGWRLKFIPRCEVSSHGYGASFVAPTASGPVYVINDSQLLASDGEDPIEIARNENLGSNTTGDNKRQIPNILPIQHTNPGIGGSAWAVGTDLTTSIRDEADIQNYGPVMAQAKQLPFIWGPDVALRAGWPMLRRMQIIDPLEARFRLPSSHFLLDPADLISLAPSQPSPELPTNPFDVRIKTITINENDELECTAEPFYYGAHCPNTTQTPPSTNSGGDPNSTYQVGNVNTPVIFEATARLAGTVSGNGQIWLVISNSDAEYGGCSLWISTDGGSTYIRLNALIGNGVTGLVYNSNYPIGVDPDITDDLYVDLTESLGTLSAFSVAQRDAFQSVFYFNPGGTLVVNGKNLTIPYELGAYCGVLFQSANKYKIQGPGNGIRRGVFTTPIAAHNIGQRFAFLGNQGDAPGIFKIVIDPTWYGRQLFFKFTSFNKYLAMEQSLASVTAYSFTPTGLVGGGNQQNNAYTLSSSQGAVVVYQGKPAGWGSIGQPTWTNPNRLYLLNCTANFPTGPAPYGIEIEPSNLPGTGTYFVTGFDPGFVGFSGNTALMHYDTSATNANTPGYTFFGKIVITDLVNGGAVAGSGGNPSGGQIS